MDGHGKSLKPCPFCGGRAVQIIVPKVLSRCVWIECSDCRVTSPMMEYQAIPEDVKETGKRLREAQEKAAAFWNTRAHDYTVQSD